MIGAVILEGILVASAVAGLVAALIGWRQSAGWRRVGWGFIAAGFGWVVLGELVLQATGWTGLIVRWTRAVPARVLIASGLWFLVWRGRRR